MRTVFLLLVVTSLASAEPTTFVSDTTWKASDTVEDFDDWVKPKYDDSKWEKAADYGMNEEKWKHFTVDNIFGFASDANWIWTKADKGGFLRAHFTAPAGYRTAVGTSGTIAALADLADAMEERPAAVAGHRSLPIQSLRRELSVHISNTPARVAHQVAA